MCTLGVYASNQACHMHRICSEPLLWESGHDKCTETRDIHVAGAALSAWTFPCISSCSDLPTRSDAFSGLAWPKASMPFSFDFHSMFNDFHCFSTISIDFHRFLVSRSHPGVSGSFSEFQAAPGPCLGAQRRKIPLYILWICAPFVWTAEHQHSSGR